jgi:uncharacterized surface protein with fasciclin (FAS1) repeats
MKRKLIAAIGIAVAASFVAPSVNAAPATSTRPTLAQILLADSRFDDKDGFDRLSLDFDIVTQAILLYPDLVTAASSPGNLTAFLPTDNAFRRLVTDLTGTSPATEKEVFGVVAGLGLETVRAVLEYHIVGSRITYGQALKSNGAAITTLGGSSFTVSVSGSWIKTVTLIDNDPDLRNPKVVLPNLAASNGVAHAIDRVLLPINV